MEQRNKLESRRLCGLQQQCEPSLHPDAVTTARVEVVVRRGNITKAATAGARRQRQEEAAKVIRDAAIHLPAPNDATFINGGIVTIQTDEVNGGALTPVLHRLGREAGSRGRVTESGPSSRVNSRRVTTCETDEVVVTPDKEGTPIVPTTQLATDLRSHPTDKYGCCHFGVECLKPMETRLCKVYLRKDSFLVGKQCSKCNTMVNNMPAVGAFKWCLYYCNNDLMSPYLDKADPAYPAMHCGIIFCVRCHGKQMALLETERSLAQAALGGLPTTNRRGRRNRGIAV